MMEYILLTILFMVLMLLYFRVADKYNIIDKPNHRSSHTSITLRGGGIIFPLAILTASIMGNASVPFMAAVVLVGTISFIDDIKPLHQLPRVGAHLIAVALVLYDLELFHSGTWYWVPLVFILAIGWINAFNFMDGINGITVLYALSAITTFAWLNRNDASFELLVVMGLACFVFGFFNVRKKAKTFAGDVGSVSMALFLAYFMIKVIFETGQIAYILFFAVYGIDAVITIMYRIKNKENIFEAHRSHLYQYLANELKWPHIIVSSLYAITQLAINALVLWLVDSGVMSIWMFIAILFLMTVFYLVMRKKVKAKFADAKY